MDSSFFEYRDKAGASNESDSDSEVIDNSLVADDSLILASAKKTPGKRNKTVVVAESEESYSDVDSDEEQESLQTSPKLRIRRSSLMEKHVIPSSSDDDEGSPEILPKRRPPTRPKSNESDNSIIGRKKNKRMILLDSDTENSIVIEHENHKKITCLKDTPLKIDDNKTDLRKAALNISRMDKSVNNEQGEESSSENTNDEDNDSDVNSRHKNDKIIQKGDKSDDSSKTNLSDHIDVNSDDDLTEDEGPDEDQMAMSRATRMSIMGVIPKDNDSDESDFIQSEENSRASSRNSIAEMFNYHSDVPKKTDPASDSSRITSPFSSPLHDITNEVNSVNDKQKDLKSKVLTNILADKYKENIRSNEAEVTFVSCTKAADAPGKIKKVIDDDVTIIDTKPEIIALSSDDEDELQPQKPSRSKSASPTQLKPTTSSRRKSASPNPKAKASTSTKKENTLTNYMAPPSYPNQVVYVKKHVRENELSKLEGLKADLHNVKAVLEGMDIDTLPDKGSKIIERLSGLERQVRAQGDKVANMLVEPDVPSAQDIARDGFNAADKGLSWDDIQKASNAVQPRMFGKQAMSTHMAERNTILERLRDLHESLASRPPETAVEKAPRSLRSTLMPHQLHALAWLRWRETQRPCGGILADDMGLGKTITMITLMLSDKEGDIGVDDDDDEDFTDRSVSKLSRGGTLVVCPASLMQQWSSEVSKHCSSHALSVCLHHGATRATLPHRLATNDLVVTTYNILQRDNEKNGVLMKILWRRVILDEAHIVRNHKSATSAAVSALRGRRRWCLTGTPVQNKDLDLFALLKFLRCTPFDELTMWKKWIDNKSVGGQERLSTIMRCILLRRTKQQLQSRGQLACLPTRSAHHTEVTLSKEEMNVYQKVLVFSKTLFAQFLHQRAEKQSDGGLAPPSEKNSHYAHMHKKMIALQGAKPVKSHEILVLLLRLRQVCCHCGLIAAMLDEDGGADVVEDPAGQDLLAELNKLTIEDKRRSRSKEDKDKEDAEEKYEEGTTAAEAIRSVLSPNNPVFELDRRSSKITAVMKCLKENVFSNKDNKAVVVSQWTSVLSLVEAELKKERIKCVTLSGAVSVPARPPLIAKLNDPKSDVRVMLLSLCAGGVGLNLCGANHLLLLDPHWNPQLEEQAQDRIYRVGQNKPVHIYRFMCVDTVEQSIRKLQQIKLELAENVLTGARNTNASKLTIEDLKMLFNMGQ